MLSFLTEEIMIGLTIFGILIPAFISVFSVLNYDSFDRKLMPRNKSAITFIKQVVAIFLITIPTFILSAYFIGYFLIKISFINLILISTYFVICVYLISLILSFADWCLDKTKNSVLKKVLEWKSLNKLNQKYKVHINFILILTFLTNVASSHLQNQTTDILTKDFIFEFLIISTFMSLFTIIILLPIYETKNKKEYKLLINTKTESELLTLLQDNPIILEYFLNDYVTVYSAVENQYRIIKRKTSDSDFSYEVYEVVKIESVEGVQTEPPFGNISTTESQGLEIKKGDLHMNDLEVMGAIHTYMTGLENIEYTLEPKSLVIGYKHISSNGKSLHKIVTLHGSKRYRCVVLHVDAGNPNSMKGKEVQKQVQTVLNFDIRDCRNILLKHHEAFIPFEVISSVEKLEYVKKVIQKEIQELKVN